MRILNRTNLNKPWAVLKYAHTLITKDDVGPRYKIKELPYATKISPQLRILERHISQSTLTADLKGGDRIYYIDLFHPNAKGIEGLTILHLSDLHLQAKPKRKIIDATRFLKTLTVDLILISGDIIHTSKDLLDDEMKELLKAPKARLGKFYVYGDHERKLGHSLAKFNTQMKQCGYTNLTNTNKLFKQKRNIRIIGFDDIRRGKINYKKAMKETTKKEFNIAITHNLDALNETVPNILDLVLWGHLHAGELNLLLMDGFSFMKADGKYFDLNGHRSATKACHFLTNRTLSYANPGFYSYFRDAGLRRVNTLRQGMAIITMRSV